MDKAKNRAKSPIILSSRELFGFPAISTGYVFGLMALVSLRGLHVEYHPKWEAAHQTSNLFVTAMQYFVRTIEWLSETSVGMRKP